VSAIGAPDIGDRR